jgi:hypothetical protein
VLVLFVAAAPSLFNLFVGVVGVDLSESAIRTAPPSSAWVVGGIRWPSSTRRRFLSKISNLANNPSFLRNKFTAAKLGTNVFLGGNSVLFVGNVPFCDAVEASEEFSGYLACAAPPGRVVIPSLSL